MNQNHLNSNKFKLRLQFPQLTQSQHYETVEVDSESAGNSQDGSDTTHLSQDEEYRLCSNHIDSPPMSNAKEATELADPWFSITNEPHWPITGNDKATLLSAMQGLEVVQNTEEEEVFPFLKELQNSDQTFCCDGEVKTTTNMRVCMDEAGVSQPECSKKTPCSAENDILQIINTQMFQNGKEATELARLVFYDNIDTTTNTNLTSNSMMVEYDDVPESIINKFSGNILPENFNCAIDEVQADNSASTDATDLQRCTQNSSQIFGASQEINISTQNSEYLMDKICDLNQYTLATTLSCPQPLKLKIRRSCSQNEDNSLFMNWFVEPSFNISELEHDNQVKDSSIIYSSDTLPLKGDFSTNMACTPENNELGSSLASESEDTNRSEETIPVNTTQTFDAGSNIPFIEPNHCLSDNALRTFPEKPDLNTYRSKNSPPGKLASRGKVLFEDSEQWEMYRRQHSKKAKTSNKPPETYQVIPIKTRRKQRNISQQGIPQTYDSLMWITTLHMSAILPTTRCVDSLSSSSTDTKSTSRDSPGHHTTLHCPRNTRRSKKTRARSDGAAICRLREIKMQVSQWLNQTGSPMDRGQVQGLVTEVTALSTKLLGDAQFKGTKRSEVLQISEALLYKLKTSLGQAPRQIDNALSLQEEEEEEESYFISFNDYHENSESSPSSDCDSRNDCTYESTIEPSRQEDPAFTANQQINTSQVCSISNLPINTSMRQLTETPLYSSQVARSFEKREMELSGQEEGPFGMVWSQELAKNFNKLHVSTSVSVDTLLPPGSEHINQQVKSVISETLLPPGSEHINQQEKSVVSETLLPPGSEHINQQVKSVISETLLPETYEQVNQSSKQASAKPKDNDDSTKVKCAIGILDQPISPLAVREQNVDPQQQSVDLLNNLHPTVGSRAKIMNRTRARRSLKSSNTSKSKGSSNKKWKSQNAPTKMQVYTNVEKSSKQDYQYLPPSTKTEQVYRRKHFEEDLSIVWEDPNMGANPDFPQQSQPMMVYSKYKSLNNFPDHPNPRQQISPEMLRPVEDKSFCSRQKTQIQNMTETWMALRDESSQSYSNSRRQQDKLQNKQPGHSLLENESQSSSGNQKEKIHPRKLSNFDLQSQLEATERQPEQMEFDPQQCIVTQPWSDMSRELSETSPNTMKYQLKETMPVSCLEQEGWSLDSATSQQQNQSSHVISKPRVCLPEGSVPISLLASVIKGVIRVTNPEDYRHSLDKLPEGFWDNDDVTIPWPEEHQTYTNIDKQ
uniref:Uncharacterized protein n=1 Tax=Timema bartmani TaxID=61472 RepID=A0A7R9ESM5_9NEOP|nr:unnamed protein product [Timema bartmani]